MRTVVATIIGCLALACSLALPSLADAKSFTASAGGVTATLSYTNGPGITTTNERLRITAPGMPTYDQPVPATGCFKVCSPPGDKSGVQVVDLYGDGEYAVVLTLWTGGADCCGLEQVYVPSAAVHSWVLTSRNFGHYGAGLTKLGGQERFISGDNAFYCTFTGCAGSGLPLQVFSFTAEAFHNVTRSYPSLIERDAAGWLKTYRQHIHDGEGVLAAWAADEDELGHEAAVASMLNREVAARHISQSFAASLRKFLQHHGYLAQAARATSHAAPFVQAATVQTASAGGVTATFSFEGKVPNFTNLRLQIVRNGTTAYDRPVAVSLPQSCADQCWPQSPDRKHPSVHVLTLEPGQPPDVLLDLYSGGAHCCSIAQVYRYDAASGTYTKSEHNFGDPGYRIEDLGHDGRFEFRSADYRFAYAFTDFAASGMPIQIWSFATGRFTDVTRRFPALIAKDAASWLRNYRLAIKFGDDVGLIAAWAADEDLLGHGSLVNHELATELAAGHLKSPLGGGAKFVVHLKRFLKAQGYARS